MSALSIQVTYRKGRSFAAYIYLARRPGEKAARTEQVYADVVVDYAADGRPLGIEIVNPAAVTLEDINRVFDQLGLSRPEASELEPLRAA